VPRIEAEIGTAGAQQSFHLLNCFINHAARLVLNLTFQFNETTPITVPCEATRLTDPWNKVDDFTSANALGYSKSDWILFDPSFKMTAKGMGQLNLISTHIPFGLSDHCFLCLDLEPPRI